MKREDELVQVPTRLSYMTCQKGGFHQEQFLNFVCLDPACQEKGLACPVCKSTDHDGHKMIPLKIFLNELRKNYSLLVSQDSTSSLSAYLNQLEEVHRSTLGALRTAVQSVALSFCKLEEQIIANYSNVRNIILSQAFASGNLPSVFNKFCKNQYSSPSQAKEQLRKVAQIVQLNGNNGLVIIKGAEDLVQKYKLLPDKLETHLAPLMTHVQNWLKNTNIEMDQSEPKTSTRFSDKDKAVGITLASELKASGQGGLNNEGGETVKFALIETGGDEKSVTLKVSNENGNLLLVGVVKSDLVSVKNYICSEEQLETLGLFLCGGEFIPMAQYSEQCDLFLDHGTEIQLKFNSADGSLVFKKKGSSEVKKSLFWPAADLQKAKLAVGFGANTSAQIIPQ